MAEILQMPRMSDTMEEGNVVSWLAKVGDTVEPGDTLAEIETDKAVMELDSPFEGVLLHIEVPKGVVTIGGVLCVIGEKGEDFKEALAAAKSANSAASTNGQAEKEVAVAEPAPAAKAFEPQHVPPQPAIAPVAAPSSGQRLIASPLAKRMAAEGGVDLTSVTGSGDSGRIIKRDIEAFIASGGQAQPATNDSSKIALRPFAPMGQEQAPEEVPLSQMRKVIAKRLGESKYSAPHFYLTMEINMDQVVVARKSLNELSPVKISYNDLVVKAAAMALHHHPAVNASWTGSAIRYNKVYNIGVAVAVDEGLLVPVIRHADQKSLSQISSEVRELAGKAKSRKLQGPEMEGNTFTISNLGMFGIEEFTAIINPPDSCIMAVGGIIEKPVVENGEIVPGHRMKVTLSCDHRVVDGASGAQFLQTFKQLLENPVRLLI